MDTVTALTSLYWLTHDTELDLVQYTLAHVAVALRAATLAEVLQKNIVAACWTLATVPVLHIALVLLGAYAFTYVGKTALLAVHIAFYAAFPVLRAFLEQTPHLSTRARLRMLLGTTPRPVKLQVPVRAAAVIAGCFVSAAVIPLDWNRWWQAWPLPVVFGCELGLLLGSLYHLAAAVLGRLPTTLTVAIQPWSAPSLAASDEQSKRQ
ncbi:Nitrogen permease regulator-like 2 [Sorochytrium milnesiophthora]